MKIIPMEKEENRIFSAGILEIIFWKDDEKSFLLIQEGRKKGFISNQILILLRWLWREEIRKLWIFRQQGGYYKAAKTL
jgi:hypothetical protein